MNAVKKAAPYVACIIAGAIFAPHIKSALAKVPVVNKVPGL